MKHSPTLENLALSLVAAQDKLANPKTDSKAKVKTKTGADYSYTYLSLPALLDAVRPILAENGLAVVQEVVENARGIGIVTRLIHASGQWLELGPLVLPAGGNAQEHGKQRYVWAPLFACCPARYRKLTMTMTVHLARIALRASPAPKKRAADREESGATSGTYGEGVTGDEPPASRAHAGCGGEFEPADEKPGWGVCNKCSAWRRLRG